MLHVQEGIHLLDFDRFDKKINDKEIVSFVLSVNKVICNSTKNEDHFTSKGYIRQNL